MSEQSRTFDINAVLTFRDEVGREFLAGALVGPLLRYADDGSVAETIEPESLRDRAFGLHGIKLVTP